MNIDRALTFATNAHKGQVRKYTNQAYINHPIRVANLLAMYTNHKPTIIAALLHDTVEDTIVSLTDIEYYFGSNVVNIVYYCTHVEYSYPELNRVARKELDLNHYSAGPKAAQNIKVADMIDNCYDIMQHDQKFANVYMNEKFRLCQALYLADKNLKQRFFGLYKCWKLKNKLNNCVLLDTFGV